MQNHAPALDVDAVRAFTLVADLASFTRAAQTDGTTQSAVSLKLKRLEARLGVRLVERTPRSVRLTADGAAFLTRARDLLAAHDRALAGAEAPERRLTIGFSDHAAGLDLAPLIARVSAVDAALHLDVRIGMSNQIADAFEAGGLDAAVIRRDKGRRGGEPLVEDTFGWFATPGFRRRPGDRLKLAMLAAPCSVRAQSIRALDKAGIAWIEAFTGGGIAAVAAAVMAGLAVAPLAARVAPAGTLDIGPALGLPSLGRSTVALYSRVSDARARAALRTLAATFRGIAAKR
ncbi:MAG TPA: LysR family transcriptional regulator [Pseudolabrys sp.]|uniref:LysR family transcriptional regulator n=1 Tax=Pseudolabrys sp. TaxID=1960880 RepID=UPI002DDD7A2B|nr:LysR family transcriptional regulator [Pseudolabrys sp.]HEV2627875.1 LysR family transcriptional regulator [Pseudolabrys sp.]